MVPLLLAMKMRRTSMLIRERVGRGERWEKLIVRYPQGRSQAWGG